MVGVAVEPTLMVMVLELAVAGSTQFALEVNTQLTTSLLASAAVLNEELLVPALFPLTCHW
jgi:hypothetical protein